MRKATSLHTLTVPIACCLILMSAAMKHTVKTRGVLGKTPGDIDRITIDQGNLTSLITRSDLLLTEVVGFWWRELKQTSYTCLIQSSVSKRCQVNMFIQD